MNESKETISRWKITNRSNNNNNNNNIKEDVEDLINQLMDFSKKCDKDIPNTEVSIDPIF